MLSDVAPGADELHSWRGVTAATQKRANPYGEPPPAHRCKPPPRVSAPGRDPAAANGRGAAQRLNTLNVSQYEFCLNYLANGFNATAAYKAAYPGATLRSARELGHRLLTKVDIKEFLANQLDKGWAALHISGDEALARLSMIARADIRLLFGEDGNLLMPHEWPDEIANCVESVDLKSGKVKLVSKLAALRMILEHTGMLRSRADGVDALAAALQETLERNTDLSRCV